MDDFGANISRFYCVFFRYAFGVVFNGLTLGLNSEARGLTMHCGLLHGHNIYSLGLVLVTGE